MTTDQWFAIITLFLTAAFTALLLSFAWRAIRIWRAEKGKTKRIETAIEGVTYCDGCAKQTNDLTAVPIAGIGISHQCPKCTPIIEEYERRYQKGKANDQR